jgi:hypothetical protein
MKGSDPGINAKTLEAPANRIAAISRDSEALRNTALRLVAFFNTTVVLDKFAEDV